MFRHYLKSYLLFILLLLFAACGGKQPNQPVNSYPAMEGFNKAASDSTAMVLANKVMKAMGGYKSWKNTHYIAWTFLGRRRLVWDKFTGDVRINSLKKPLKILLNIHSMEGKVMKGGKVLNNPDSVEKYLEMGRRIWINDSYWLVMPFKMKDSGVTLHYVGQGETKSGIASHIVALTFEDVGVTPKNKFKVWIDKQSHLVRQWAYFRYAKQDSVNFMMPWNNYKKYGNILLSGDRGKLALTHIMVLDSVSGAAFNSFAPISLK